MSDEFVLHRGIGNPSKCRSCKAPIAFAETTSGKVAPFETDPDGHYVLENGKAVFVGKPSVQLELGETAPKRYTSHFSKCPHASKWRSRK